jgi:hypothetical protein
MPGPPAATGTRPATGTGPAPIASGASPFQQRQTLIIAAVAVVAAAIVLFLVLGGGDDTATASSLGGVQVRAPEGWSSRSLEGITGRLMALNASDLSQTLPDGPRIRVQLIRAGADADPASIAALAQPPLGPDTASVVDGPKDVALGGGQLQGVEITLAETYAGRSLTSKYVVTPTPSGDALLITCEAPSESFAQHAAACQFVLDGAVRR